MANTADETEDGGWDSDGLGYHTPGDDEDGDMEMSEAACEDCGPLRDRPASAVRLCLPRAWQAQPDGPCGHCGRGERVRGRSAATRPGARCSGPGADAWQTCRA